MMAASPAASPADASGPVEGDAGAPRSTADTAGQPAATAPAAATDAAGSGTTGTAPAAAAGLSIDTSLSGGGGGCGGEQSVASPRTPPGAIDDDAYCGGFDEAEAPHAMSVAAAVADDAALAAICESVPEDRELARMDVGQPYFIEANVPPVKLAEIGLPFEVDEEYGFANDKAGPYDCDDHSGCCMRRPHRISISKSGAEPVWSIDPELNPNEIGLVCAVSHMQGRRSYMEDRHRALYGQADPSELRVCIGVYDGHGGQRASELVAQIMPGALQEALHRTGPNLARALPLAYRIMEREVLASSFEEESHTSGTTALTHAIVGQMLYTANVGDCRAILCRRGRPVVLTRDHKPSDPLEKRRVTKLGGEVVQNKVTRPKYLCCGAMTDVPLGPSRVMPGGLAVARTLGDIRTKLPELGSVPVEGIISASPEMSVVRLCQDDDYILSASDGFWDVFSNDDAVKIFSKLLHQHKHKEAVRLLCEKAIEKGSEDNVTVSVCFFTHHNGPWSLDPAVAETVSVPEDLHTLEVSRKTDMTEYSQGGGGSANNSSLSGK